MGKSLGDYNIEKSSAADVNNIQWTQKTPRDTEKLKKKKLGKKHKNTSALNIIYSTKTKKAKPPIEKVFKIEEKIDAEKSKKEKLDKRHKNSPASVCNIKQGFKRPAR